MAQADYERATMSAVTPPEKEERCGFAGGSDTSRVRWKLKNVKSPFTTWRHEAEDWLLVMDHSEQYAPRLGIDIKYEFHTAWKSCACRHGFIDNCPPESSKKGPLDRFWNFEHRAPDLDGKELRHFIENVKRMKVQPLCAMQRLGLLDHDDPVLGILRRRGNRPLASPPSP